MSLTAEEIAAEEAAIETHEKRKRGSNLPPCTMEVAGWIIPDTDARLAGRLTSSPLARGRATYNMNRLLRAISYCTNYRTAIDVGAHVGFMTFWLRQIFASVISYEPHALHASCLFQNVHNQPGEWSYYAQACGAEAGSGRLSGETSEKTYLTPGSGPVEVIPLDDHAWLAVDFLKIDCEGFEQQVVEGASETIAKWRPVIMIEQKEGVAARRYGFEDLGAIKRIREIAPYRIVYEDNGDYVLCPKKS